ncbi:MAG: AmmeMemoRadiSam system protein B [Candidatus Omnitrophota bacterium]
MIREAVVSGQFYPSRVSELKKTIEEFGQKDSAKKHAYAIIVPHAGYVYSGRVATATISKVLAKKRLIILGPNHTGYGEDFGLFSKGSWKTPFGDMQIDEELADRIIKSGSAIVKDELCHKFEHSIEVELPFLYYYFKEFKFVPIVCQVSDIAAYKEVAAQIFSAIKDIKEEVMLVASSDMTHYEPDPAARKKDRLALEHITNLDAEGLLKIVKKENITMCGIAPVAITLLIAKEMGAAKASVSLYQTSADSGAPSDSVVGYAGVIIS